MEKKLTIKAKGVEIILEGYSIQELNDMFSDEQVEEINLKDLVNKQREKDFKNRIEEEYECFCTKPKRSQW